MMMKLVVLKQLEDKMVMYCYFDLLNVMDNQKKQMMLKTNKKKVTNE